MKKNSNRRAENEYSPIVWTSIKLLLILYWLSRIVIIYLQYHSTPLPQGIFTFFSFSYAQIPWIKYLFISVAIILSIMYFLEINMRVTTLLLFIFSVFSFSFEESNGVLNIYSLLSFLFFAQFAAYVLPFFSERLRGEEYRFEFSVQAISAAYTLSALSKISVSGPNWIYSGKFMALQILKSFQYKYVTNGDWSAVQQGQEMAIYLIQNPAVTTFLLSAALVLELFALVAVLNVKLRFWYGLSLLCMHIAIWQIMNINLFSISFLMALFFIFPPLINRIIGIIRRQAMIYQ